jgi:predicted ATPase
VSVVGASGVGTSRLALAVAEATANSFSGGTWWIPVADLEATTATDVARRVADACTIERTGDPLSAAVDHFGALADALVIVDGTEHCTVGARQFTDALLSRCPDVRVVSTGPSPLGLSGEHLHRVGGLSVPPADFDGTIADLAGFDATALFIERMERAGASPTGRDSIAIADICRSLLGVPQSIEVAAAQAAEVSIDDVAAIVGQLIRSDGTDDTAPPGPASETSVSSIAWSYRLLDAESRRVLSRLTVFRSGIELDAAASVGAGAGRSISQVEATIEELVARHLATVDGDRLLLPERLRSLAARELSPADATEASAAHATWFAGVAERFDEAGLSVPIAWISPDEADVFAALEACIADGSVETYRFVTALAPRWHQFDRADSLEAAGRWVAARPPGDGEIAWASAIARLVFAQGHLPDSIVHSYADEALAIAELCGDLVSPLFIAHVEAVSALRRGDIDPGLALFESALRAGVDTVAASIGWRLIESDPADPRCSEVERQLSSIPGAATFRGPGAIRAVGHDDEGDETATSVLHDMAPPTGGRR